MARRWRGRRRRPLLRLGGDQWWPVFPVLFGPRWVWLAVPVAALPWLAARPRRAMPPFLLALFAVVVGIMGFTVGPARLLPARRGPTVRIMTFNAASKGAVVRRATRVFDSLGVTIAMLEECPSLDRTATAPPPGWSLHSEGELCLYTVDSVLSWQPRSQDDIWRLHGKLSAARARVVVDGGVLDIGMLHLKSARDAIDDFFDLSTIPTLGPVVDSIERIRNIEAGLAEEYFDGAPKGPMVVGGRLQPAAGEPDLPAPLFGEVGMPSQEPDSAPAIHGIHVGMDCGSITCSPGAEHLRSGPGSVRTWGRTTCRCWPTCGCRLSERATRGTR